MENIFDSIIRFLGSLYPNAKIINNIIGTVFSIFVAYRVIYFIVGIFWTRKFIAARNEEKVIGNLIDSINKQDYPKELLTIFVVADNCTDKTASIARDKGCVCYERFDNVHKTKGYYLEYLFKNIEKY